MGGILCYLLPNALQFDERTFFTGSTAILALHCGALQDGPLSTEALISMAYMCQTLSQFLMPCCSVFDIYCILDKVLVCVCT